MADVICYATGKCSLKLYYRSDKWDIQISILWRQMIFQVKSRLFSINIRPNSSSINLPSPLDAGRSGNNSSRCLYRTDVHLMEFSRTLKPITAWFEYSKLLYLYPDKSDWTYYPSRNFFETTVEVFDRNFQFSVNPTVEKKEPQKKNWQIQSCKHNRNERKYTDENGWWRKLVCNPFWGFSFSCMRTNRVWTLKSGQSARKTNRVWCNFTVNKYAAQTLSVVDVGRALFAPDFHGFGNPGFQLRADPSLVNLIPIHLTIVWRKESMRNESSPRMNAGKNLSQDSASWFGLPSSIRTSSGWTIF